MDSQELFLQQQVARMNERASAIVLGLLMGLGLFAATNFLVIKGGVNVGAHLSLLSIYFPGYTVSYVGSLIGFVYAFVLGYGLGRLISGIYNRVSD